MLAPLFLMIFGFTFYFFTVLLLRARAELAALRTRALKLRMLAA
jgi:hypothetical protein